MSGLNFVRWIKVSLTRRYSWQRHCSFPLQACIQITLVCVTSCGLEVINRLAFQYVCGDAFSRSFRARSPSLLFVFWNSISTPPTTISPIDVDSSNFLWQITPRTLQHKRLTIFSFLSHFFLFLIFLYFSFDLLLIRTTK